MNFSELDSREDHFHDLSDIDIKVILQYKSFIEVRSKTTVAVKLNHKYYQ